MHMVDVIRKKRDGGVLTREEITWFVDSYTQDIVPDYQISALMMAIYYQGMTPRETYDLTMAMTKSGDMLSLRDIPGIKVDKHSTGGVGDKTSLALTPMVAACGVPIAKMSGRGLGHTGGTIDKLECFPGFHTNLTTEQFIHNVNTIGIAIMGQTQDLAPADKKLYALRDVTATVESLPLIAASIMSKKLAAGADAIVLDVKTGSGAFMQQESDAAALAKEMVEIGKSANRKTVAILSDMDQPLGNHVGNALEVQEAIWTLQGKGPADFWELCLTLGTQMLLLGEKASTPDEARRMLENVVADGSALRKLAQLVAAQGGDETLVYHPEGFPKASLSQIIPAAQTGYLAHIQCEAIGHCSLRLGGGREVKDSLIDLSVGLILHQKVGAYVKQGDPLATLYANDQARLMAAAEICSSAYSYSDQPVPPKPLIKGIYN
jgi:pyrimidine-nucleoside phosphorylase